MTENNHKLKTQKMELTLSHDSRANEVFTLVSELCHTELLATIGKCLDEFAPSGQTLYAIDKIELHVEPIEYEEVKTELPVKVYESLRKTLIRIFADLNESSVITVHRIADSNLSVVSYFLEHGFLPWNNQENDLSSLLTKCIVTNPEALAKLIRKKGVDHLVRIRITERFAGKIFYGIINVLERRNSATIIDYHKHLVSINKKESIVDVPQNVLEKTLWLFILNHLIIEQQTAFNQRSFSISMLRQFSCHFNIGFIDLLLLLQTGLRRWRGSLPTPFVSLIENTIMEFTHRPFQHHSQEAHITVEPLADDTMHDINVRSMQDSDRVFKDDTIVKLLSKEPKRVAPLLRSLKDKQTLIHKLICTSKDELPKKLLKAIDTADYTTIIKYHGNLTTIHAADPIPNTKQRDVENILWTFMIIHCLENHQSYFNHKAFLKSILFSFSAHYNLSKILLLEKMISSASALQVQSGNMRKCLTLINEIYLEESHHTANPYYKDSLLSKYRKIANTTKSKTLVNHVRPLSEKQILHLLKRNRTQTATFLREYLYSNENLKLINSFSPEGFNTIIRSVLPTSIINSVNQFLLLTEKIRLSLRRSFNSETDYRLKVRLSVLEIIREVNQSNSTEPERIFKRLIQSFALKSTKLSYKKLQEQIALHKGDLKLHLLTSILTKKDGNDLMLQGKDTLVGRLIDHLLLVNTNTLDFFPGFHSNQEVFGFLHDQYPKALTLGISELSIRKREHFINQLNDTDLDQLISLQNRKERTMECLALVREWDHHLLGHNNRNEILAALKRALLIGYVFNASSSMDELAKQLLVVLEKFELLESFFDAMTKWTLPRYGDPATAIQKIEKEVMGTKAKSNTVKKKLSKRILVKNVLSKLKIKQIAAEEHREESTYNDIYLSNAGLVLIHPYLPYLFEQCHLMENGKFKTREGAIRSISMLQYAVTGLEEFKEEDHVLNKILCGVNLNENSNGIKLAKEEIKLINEMLLALAEHWPAIKNSTEEDIRGNWLVREGRLRETEEYWELKVKRKSYDILMDSLPFTLSPIKYSWMKKRILIDWLL